MTAMRAMMGWCWGVILFGVVLAGGAFAATDGVAVLLLERFGGAPAPMKPALRFAVGLMGAVSIGWGASLLALASMPMPADLQRALWRRIGWAVAAWFVIDSIISAATGFWPNAVSNMIFAAIFFAIRQRPG